MRPLKDAIHSFIGDLIDMLDTETEVKVSLTNFSGQTQTIIFPVEFIANENFDSYLSDMGKYEIKNLFRFMFSKINLEQ